MITSFRFGFKRAELGAERLAFIERVPGCDDGDVHARAAGFGAYDPRHGDGPFRVEKTLAFRAIPFLPFPVPWESIPNGIALFLGQRKLFFGVFLASFVQRRLEPLQFLSG